MTVALSLLGVAVAQTLTVTGGCPGYVALDVTESTPGGEIVLLTGKEGGDAPLPSGPCAGVASVVGAPLRRLGRPVPVALDGTRNLFTTAGGNVALFVRFGVKGRLNSAGDTEFGEAQLRIAPSPLASRTIASGPVLIHTLGSATKVFVPTGGVLTAEWIAEARATLQLDQTSGDTTVEVGYQTTDTPDDPTSWSTVTTIGSSRTSVGTSYGTTFSSVSLSARYIRFGLVASNTSGSDIEVAVGSIRVDVRE